MTSPWELRETAVAAGLNPSSLTERSARRRTGDAGLGRDVVVPAYLRRTAASAVLPTWGGLLVRLSPGGRVVADRGVYPIDLGDPARLWDLVSGAARAGATEARAGWTRVAIGTDRTGAPRYLLLRDADWALLATALALALPDPDVPQDAPAERVQARFLGRLDGLDGTASDGLWGRLALEAVSRRHPERLADTRALRWHASWGWGGFPAGSAGRANGAAGLGMLLDLAHQRVSLEDRHFRVRTLPDWEREQAAADLGLPPRRLMAWPVAPLSVVVNLFTDITPAPLEPEPGGPQDAR